MTSVDEQSLVTEEMFNALNAIEKGDQHIFICGSAGTGKTTLLKSIKQPNQVVLSPTGVAALNAGGTTIHSFFKFSPSDTIQEAFQHGIKRRGKKTHSIYEKVETIIIDEVSMLRADLLDCIDVFLKTFLDNDKPFGGKKLIFFGDLFQLPPVEDREYRIKNSLYKYRTPYFFSSKVINKLIMQDKFEIFELTQVFRQKEEDLINILQKIRDKSVNEEDLLLINSQIHAGEDDNFATYLTPYRARAAEINEIKLNELTNESLIFNATIEGKLETWQKPNDEIIELKVGCKVMALVNNKVSENRYEYVNGQIGIVKEPVYSLEEGNTKKLIGVKVLFEGNKTESTVLVNTWEVIKFAIKEEKIEKETVGQYIQIPLQVAYATTIHKSQGLSFDSLVFDLEKKPFGTGQTYVALSRCRTIEGLKLSRAITVADIQVDYRVSNFFKSFNAYKQQI